jgi:phage terminase small subunit
MRTQRLAARVLLFSLIAGLGAARAEGPGGPPSAKGPHGGAGRPGPGGPGKGDGEPGEARGARGGHPEPPSEADKPGARRDEVGKGTKGPDARGTGMRELMSEMRAGRLKKDELKERLVKLHEQREDRIKEHRQRLKEAFGGALGAPAAREELEHHARRMARLERAMILCETETVKDKDKLKDRIQKLLDKENARHQRVMESLKATVGAPAASAGAASPLTSPSPSASAAGKGSEK